MYEKAIENLKEIGSNRKLDRLLIQSMSEIKLNKKSMVQYVVSITLAAIAAYVIVYKSDTVELFTNAVDVINNTSLALIAIVFGTFLTRSGSKWLMMPLLPLSLALMVFISSSVSAKSQMSRFSLILSS